jgi:hypothetical protein
LGGILDFTEMRKPPLREEISFHESLSSFCLKFEIGRMRVAYEAPESEKTLKTISFAIFILLFLFNTPFALAYPQIYPFIPSPTEEIHLKVAEVSEDTAFKKNIFELHQLGYSQGRAHQQPWTSTYWPLNKGMVADPYRPHINPFAPARQMRWQRNERRFERRYRRHLQEWHKLSEAELEELAPSEKYDILLGDSSFDLTHRVWDFIEKIGEGRDQSLVTKIYPPEGESADRYRIIRERTRFKLWEGICHGWATAAIHFPRPSHQVDIRLPNGKRLRFYPEDIKALASLLWAHSIIQDNRWLNEEGQPQGGGVLYAGLRCNEKKPAIDEWGRTYDDSPDRISGNLESRCVGVHPAVWHLALANIMGLQGRSFIVERKIAAPVDNHPLARYSAQYFNPYTGEYGPLERSVVALSTRDQFYSFRNRDTQKLVGVKLTMTYTDWERPSRESTDAPSQDQLKDVDMYYDLELSSDGTIIGGQWRVTEVGSAGRIRAERTQPNFFWVIAKDWQKYFKEPEMPQAWTQTTQAPPASWRASARSLAHSFVYYRTRSYGFNENCEVLDLVTGREIELPCDLQQERPQPLVNILNRLSELSRR